MCHHGPSGIEDVVFYVVFVYRVTFPAIRRSQGLSTCLDLKWQGVSNRKFLIEEATFPAQKGCPVTECRGIRERPVFSVCSLGQSEEAVSRVPEQQPLGHCRRGHSSAGGDGDCHHPLLETLPHGQVGLPAWHGGQHPAASEGKGVTPSLHTGSRMGWGGLSSGFWYWKMGQRANRDIFWF